MVHGVPFCHANWYVLQNFVYIFFHHCMSMLAVGYFRAMEAMCCDWGNLGKMIILVFKVKHTCVLSLLFSIPLSL